MGLEEEKQKFEERYNLLAGEKASIEEQVVNLDTSVEHFAQQIEALVEEKKALDYRVEEQCGQLEAEELRRKAVENDMMWLL